MPAFAELQNPWDMQESQWDRAVAQLEGTEPLSAHQLVAALATVAAGHGYLSDEQLAASAMLGVMLLFYGDVLAPEAAIGVNDE